MLSPLGDGDWTICIFKNISGYPCPACGSTTAVMHLFHGNAALAVMANPLGLAVAFIGMIALFIWFYDIFQNKILLFDCYMSFERVLNKPLPLMSLMGLILINWIWKLLV